MKSPEKIKTQIEFWFFKYHVKERNEFNGDEVFTIFDLLEPSFKEGIESALGLRSAELPVLVLKISENQFIINTTERFIRLTDLKHEYIDYREFYWHTGYKSILAEREPSGKPISIKTDGYFSEFGLKKTDGEVIYWEIPTGSPGFGFWNVTKKCELIGRKYLD